MQFRNEEDRELFEEASDSKVKDNIQCKAFISRSKGIRNGKRRIRKPKEVALVRYYSRTHSLHRAPLDLWAQEIYEADRETLFDLDADYLREQIKKEFGL